MFWISKHITMCTGCGFGKGLNKAGNIIKGFAASGLNVNNALSAERMNLCRICKHQKRGWCNECGCNLDAKTRVKEEICPIGKW